MGSTSRAKRLGRYSLTRELGRGTFGSVYLGALDGSPHPVAVKVLRAGVDAEGVARFCQEGEIGRRLEHPGIVAVFETGHDRGVHYYAMEYCPGLTLQERLRADGLLEPPEAIRVVRALAEIMAFAHEQGVIHRDLKPANVVFGSDGQPRILDFGLARDNNTLRSLTQSGDVLGTPIYMAPEQLRGERGIDHRVDVYALGAILYHCLAGRVPHRGRNVYEVSERVLHAAPEPLRGVPPRLEQVCLRALAKSAGDRFADCRQLAAALAACEGIDEDADSAPAPGIAPWKLALAVGISVVVVGFGGLALFASDDPEPAPSAPEPQVASPAPELPPPPAPEPPGPDAAQLLERARAQARAGEGYVDIRDLLEEARAAAGPDLEDTIALELAWHHYRRGAYDEAFSAARALQTSTRGETRANAWLLRARVSLHRNDFEDGMACLRRVEADIDASTATRAMCRAELAGWELMTRPPRDRAERQRALAEFERLAAAALRDDPTGLAHEACARLHMQLIRFSGQPSASAVQAIYDMALEAAKRLGDDIHPYWTLALLSWHRYSLTQDRQGLSDKVSALDRLLALCAKPNVDALMWRGHTLYLLDRFRAADDDMNELLDLAPRDVEGLLWKGATLHGLGEREAARAHWRRLFETRGDAARALLEKGGRRVELESIRSKVEQALR